MAQDKTLEEVQELKRKMGELAKELGSKLEKLPPDALDHAVGNLQVEGANFTLEVGISKLEIGPRRFSSVTPDKMMHSENNMT